MGMQCDVADAKAAEPNRDAVKISQDLWGKLVEIVQVQRQSALSQGEGKANVEAAEDWFSLVEEVASAYDAVLFKEVRIHVLNTYLTLAARLINSRGELPDEEKLVILGLRAMMSPIKPKFYRFVGKKHGEKAKAMVEPLFGDWAEPTLYLFSFIPNVLMEMHYRSRFPVIFDCVQRYNVLSPHEQQTMKCSVRNEMLTRDLVTKDFEFFKDIIKFSDEDIKDGDSASSEAMVTDDAKVLENPV